MNASNGIDLTNPAQKIAGPGRITLVLDASQMLSGKEAMIVRGPFEATMFEALESEELTLKHGWETIPLTQEQIQWIDDIWDETSSWVNENFFAFN